VTQTGANKGDTYLSGTRTSEEPDILRPLSRPLAFQPKRLVHLAEYKPITWWAECLDFGAGKYGTEKVTPFAMVIIVCQGPLRQSNVHTFC